MIAKPKVVVHKERAVHMYSELWHASDCVLKLGLKEREGSTWQFLSSIVLTAFAFEAYLNHVGPKTIEGWERFKSESLACKFARLCKELQVEFNEGPDKRPLQTIRKLFNFRNQMAHGQSVPSLSTCDVRLADDGLEAFLWRHPLTDWELQIKTSDFAQRSRDDIEAVLTKLHNARTDDKERLFEFGMEAQSATLIER